MLPYEITHQIQSAMANSGIVCHEAIIADGKLHRFKSDGDNQPNGWYVLFPNNGSFYAGKYGCWKRDIREKWCSKPINQLSQEEYKNYKAKIEEAKIIQEAERAKIRAESKNKAQQIWEDSQPADANHPYLLKKKIKPYGIRVNGDDLIIPLRNCKNEIESLQYIKPNGKKLFLEGGAISGNYYSIGKLTYTLYICEGIATAATVHEATGCGAVVAFNAGNLLAVAQVIYKKYPDKEIVVAADNDAFNNGVNIGKQTANLAAQAINAKIVIPQFKDISLKPTDFNDLQCLEGIDEARNQLHNAAILKESLEDALARLSSLTSIQYEQVRIKEAELLGVRVKILDQSIKEMHPHTPDASIDDELENGITPWYESINGEELAAELVELFRQHAILTDDQTATLVLWVFGSYCIDAFNIYPKLLITSPTMRCGKTTILKILYSLVHRGLIGSNVTAAVIFRAIDLWKPSLLIDEADTFINGNDELRGIINSGHSRETASVMRIEGDSNNRAPKRFSTWSPMVIAMIKKPPSTILDRSVVINVKRKLSTEHVKKWQADSYATLKPLRQKLKKWVDDNSDIIKNASITLPDIKNDRALDNWGSLFAIANSLGSKMLDAANDAIRKLNVIEDDESLDAMLLLDIKQIFESINISKIHSEQLVEKLIALEKSPWAEYNNGRPLTKNALANLLKSFEIKPKQMWIGIKNKNGYELSDFKEVFNRYIPPNKNSRTLDSSTGVTCELITNSRDETSNPKDETSNSRDEISLEFQSTSLEFPLEFQNAPEPSKDEGSRVLEFQKGLLEENINKEVRCADCKNFKPDTIGDGTGIGNCLLGGNNQKSYNNMPLYPNSLRKCVDFQC